MKAAPVLRLSLLCFFTFCFLRLATPAAFAQIEAPNPTESAVQDSTYDGPGGIFLTTEEKMESDSLLIDLVEESVEPKKVFHAEPLYIDLIRDLGARKGEAEWNVGLGLSDKRSYSQYKFLVEYEWAPINRLGLEIEVPAVFSRFGGANSLNAPPNRIESLKLAAQWSFLVNPKLKTSMALGYIHEFELRDFSQIELRNFYMGNLYNPFLVAAKRWGNNFHTLIYTGPMIHQNFDKGWSAQYELHTNFHYMVSGTRNFIGVEFNKYFSDDNVDIIMRPQMRLAISEKLMIGIVAGIPLSTEASRLSAFTRLIYEPEMLGHAHKVQFRE